MEMRASHVPKEANYKTKPRKRNEHIGEWTMAILCY